MAWYEKLVEQLRDSENIHQRRASGFGVIEDSDEPVFGERTLKQIWQNSVAWLIDWLICAMCIIRSPESPLILLRGNNKNPTREIKR